MIKLSLAGICLYGGLWGLWAFFFHAVPNNRPALPQPEAATSCTGCTITYNGTQTDISLNSGDVFCIPAGFTFDDDVDDFPAGATICVSSGARFEPDKLDDPAGTLINYGTTLIEDEPDAETGFTVHNYGSITFEKSIDIKGQVSFYNYEGASWIFEDDFKLEKNGSTFTNRGEIRATDDFEIDKNTHFTNYNSLTLTKELKFKGQVDNYGKIRAKKEVKIEKEANFTNYCTLILWRGLDNKSDATLNYGLIYDLGNAKEFKNKKTFTNGTDAYVVGKKFKNEGSVLGAGNFYFTGQTTNQGDFGADGGGINFYDTGTPPNIMDVVSSPIHSSVTANAFVAPDTSYVSPQCNAPACRRLIVNPHLRMRLQH